MVVEVRFLFRTRDWNEISGKIRGLSIKISDLTWNLEKKSLEKAMVLIYGTWMAGHAGPPWTCRH
jgi:hypothetical protein